MNYMKICWFGNFDPHYSRNKILIDGLRENGVTVLECGDTRKGLRPYWSLFKRLRQLHNEYDYIVCAYPVHLSIFLALFQKKPIIADAFESFYDTAVFDRKKYGRYHPFALGLLLIDVLTVKLAYKVITDTQEHKDYFSKWRNPKDIFVISVGAHSQEFYPTQLKRRDDQYLVQFHGSYNTLQGIEKIVGAANILKTNASIQFRFIGTGQQYERIQKLVTSYKLKNITFIPWLTIPELNTALNEADIVLGIFGDTEKTDRVVPNKLFQGLAVCKPVITKDTESVRRLFDEQDLVLVPNTDEAIAAAILKLKDNPVWCHQLAQNGKLQIEKSYREIHLAKILIDLLSL